VYYLNVRKACYTMFLYSGFRLWVGQAIQYAPKRDRELDISQPSAAGLSCSDKVTNKDEVIRHPRHRAAVSSEADYQTTLLR
jgi:hypothetical protein